MEHNVNIGGAQGEKSFLWPGRQERIILGGMTNRAPLSLLWLQAASCGGCTMSAISHESEGLAAVLERIGIQLLWHPSLSEECGAEAVAILEDCRSGKRPLDILCIEGAVLRGPDGSGRFHILSGTGKAMSWWVSELASKARMILAVGSCAAFGAVPMSNPLTEASGLQFAGDEPGGLLGEGWHGAAGLPVVNLAGCAPHPGWLLETLAAMAQGHLEPSDLDIRGRPRFWANHLAHHGCARNEYYEFKASAAHHGQMGCLMENLGCKATQAPGDCNLRVWNGSSGGCTNAGYACIGCTMPGFEAPGAPFLETAKVAGIPIGLPVDMPKAWFVALSALSKSATPERVRKNARHDRVVVPPRRKTP